MTRAEIAKRLREICDSAEGIRLFANELDPPKPETPMPEPGTVVRFRNGVYGITCHEGVATVSDSGLLNFVSWEDVPILSNTQVHILADDEVAVKIPPVRDWPGKCDEVSLRWHQYLIGDEFIHNYAGVSITRAEAERMEEER